MKIVQLITHMDTIGGAQVHVHDISIRLKEEGHTIYVVTGGDEKKYKLLGKSDIKPIFCKNLIRRLNIISDIKAVFEIRKIIKTIQPDLIATHSSKAGVVGRIAGWSLGIPTIFTAHGWSFTEGVSNKKKWFYIIFEKAVGLLSDGVITVSKYDKELAIKYKVLPERKMITIHNGVHDIEDKSKVVHSSERPNIIMVARFSPPKKQLQLLKALNQLRHIEWNMYFVGDGTLLEETKSYVEREKLNDRVYFLGNRQDITEFLQKSDLFVLISDWEGLPLSILEAMRCGLPIIASDVGGVREAVLQSMNGHVVPRNDTHNLISKLTLLLTNPMLRTKMGDKSRALYEENFTFELMYKKTITYYEKVIKLKRYK